MKIENLVKVDAGATQPGQSAKKMPTEGADFLATLLTVNAQGEQGNPQYQDQAKGLVNGLVNHGQQNPDLMALDEGQLKVLANMINDSRQSKGQASLNMQQIMQLLQTNEGQQLGQQLAKQLQEMPANKVANVQIAQLLQTEEGKQLAQELAKQLQQQLPQMSANKATKAASTQITQLLQTDAGRQLVQQLAKQWQQQMPPTNNGNSAQDRPMQLLADPQAQTVPAGPAPRASESAQTLLTQLANLVHQGQTLRESVPNQPAVTQVGGQATEQTSSLVFTSQTTGLNATVAKEDIAPLPAQLGSRFAELLKEMAVRQQPNQTTMRLRLKPASLGEVTVRLTYNRGELNAQFFATTGHGKEALEAALPQLRDTLLQQQVKLTESSVFLTNDDSRWLGRQANQQQNFNGRGKTYQQVDDGNIKIDNLVANAENSAPTQTGLNLLV